MGIDRSLFVDEVPDDCICYICQDVLEDPKETLTCQHAFYQMCIITWLEEHKSCPSCRCPLSGISDLVTLHRVWRDKLNHLKVRCQNHPVGCDEVVCLEKLHYHYHECPFMRVNCPHSPCGEVVMRSKLPSHREACGYRQVKCQNCRLRVLAISLKDHECIPALREEMKQQLENNKREWTESLRAMRREQRKLEEKVHVQASQIAELRTTIALLTSSRKPPTLRNLPTIGVSGSAMRVTTHPGTCQGHSTRSNRRESRVVDMSLPRLAPLHTHMSLSRNSSRYSDGSRPLGSRPESEESSNQPR